GRLVLPVRVLDREDVEVLPGVQEVDAGSERRRLPRAGRARDEEQPARASEHRLDRARQPDLLERHVLRRDLPADDADVASLLEDRDAEAGLVAEREAEVGAAR